MNMKKRQKCKFYKHTNTDVIVIKQTVILHEAFQRLLFNGKQIKKAIKICSRKPVGISKTISAIYSIGPLKRFKLISPHVDVFVYKQLTETLPRITFERIR